MSRGRPVSKKTTNKTSSPAVLVFGDDDYEVKAKSAAVLTNWRNELDEAETEVVDANAGHIKEMQSSMEALHLALGTIPLFGEGKIVWFRDANFLGAEGRLAQSKQTAEAIESLLEWLKRLDWGKMRFLVSCSVVDKRKRFYKFFQQKGQVVVCESLASYGDRAEEMGVRLVMEQVGQSSKTIRQEAAEHLVRCAGLDRRTIISECEKVILHAGEQEEVTEQDVESIVTKTRQATAFAFADAVADRNLKLALERLDEELWSMRTDRQKSEIGLLYGLISKFRSLLLIKDLVNQGRLRASNHYGSFRSQFSALDKSEFPDDKRFNPLSQHPYMVFRAVAQVGNYEQAELVAALDSLMACNMRLITVMDDSASLLRECVVGIMLRKSGVDGCNN